MLKKDWQNIAETIIYIILIISIVFLFMRLKQENREMKLALEHYAIVNGNNIAKARVRNLEPMLTNIEFDTGVPAELLQSGQVQENSITFFEYGVQRFPSGITRYPINEWQARSAARIYTQIAFDYILTDPKRMEAYFELMGQRYCPKDAKYGKDTRCIFQGLKKLKK